MEEHEVTVKNTRDATPGRFPPYPEHVDSGPLPGCPSWCVEHTMQPPEPVRGESGWHMHRRVVDSWESRGDTFSVYFDQHEFWDQRGAEPVRFTIVTGDETGTADAVRTAQAIIAGNRVLEISAIVGTLIDKLA